MIVALLCTGNRYLYTTQPVPVLPQQVQLPIVIVHPDNAVGCGRKLFLDRSLSAKQDPSSYFTSEAVAFASINAQICALSLAWVVISALSVVLFSTQTSMLPVLCITHYSQANDSMQ